MNNFIWGCKNTADKDVFRSIASRNINFILDRLNIAYSRRGNTIQSNCPCKQHKGDGSNNKAFSWRDDYEHWTCFSHHCEDLYGSDIFGLVRSILECSFNDSIEWIQNCLANIKIDSNTLNVNANKSIIRDSIHIHKPLDEQRIKFLNCKAVHPYLMNRKFSVEVVQKYEIGFWNRLGTFMHNRIVCPLRDHDNRLVGFSGRTIYPESEWDKYSIKAKWIHGRYYDRWPKQDELKIGSILYNLNNVKKNIEIFNKQVVLVEGIFDGLKLEMAGVSNWIANLGGKFTPAKRSLLIKYGINEIISFYDADTGGEDANEHLRKIVGDLLNIKVVKPPPNKDPGDLNSEEIREILNVRLEKY